MKSESYIQSLIRQNVGNGPVRLFRNNVGATKTVDGRLIRYGLAKGSADLIGWVSRVIKQSDVGKTIAQFVSIEVKSPTGKPRPEQIAWAKIVAEAGGLSGIARSVDDAQNIISQQQQQINEQHN
jgi:hypothetical protein